MPASEAAAALPDQRAHFDALRERCPLALGDVQQFLQRPRLRVRQGPQLPLDQLQMDAQRVEGIADFVGDARR